MIIVSAEIDFASKAARDNAVAETLAIQQATRDDEPGCEAYCFAPDPCVDTRIQVYEAWTDQAALAAHFEHPNYLDMRTRLGELGLVGATSRKFRSDLSEPVYDESHTPRADFFTAG